MALKRTSKEVAVELQRDESTQRNVDDSTLGHLESNETTLVLTAWLGAD